MVGVRGVLSRKGGGGKEEDAEQTPFNPFTSRAIPEILPKNVDMFRKIFEKEPCNARKFFLSLNLLSKLLIPLPTACRTLHLRRKRGEGIPSSSSLSPLCGIWDICLN